MSTLKCISPIDGEVLAERPVVTLDEANAALARARAAQNEWAARPLAERIKLVQAGVARLGEMGQEVTPELAQMMGRPVRFGGEFGGVKDRSDYMGGIAESALAPIVVEDSPGFERRIEARAAWYRLRHRAVELSLSHRNQHGRSGSDGR